MDGQTEADPRLAVVARRLDSTQPLVWADWVNSAGPAHFANGTKVEGATDPSFMVTSLRLPNAECWEITAHYFPSRGNVHTLTYTVWVEP